MRREKMIRWMGEHLDTCSHCQQAFEHWEGNLEHFPSLCPIAAKKITRFLYPLVPYAALFGVIVAIDSRILRCATRISHRLQRLCGLTNYAIARFGIFLVFAAIVVTIANNAFQWRPVHLESLTIEFVYYVLLFGWICVLYRNLKFTHKAEERLYDSGEILNPYDTNLPIRIMWLTLSLMYTVGWLFETGNPLLNYVMDVQSGHGMAIFMYFLAVVPLPPGPTKIGDTLKRIFRPVKVPATQSLEH